MVDFEEVYLAIKEDNITKFKEFLKEMSFIGILEMSGMRSTFLEVMSKEMLEEVIKTLNQSESRDLFKSLIEARGVDRKDLLEVVVSNFPTLRNCISRKDIELLVIRQKVDSLNYILNVTNCEKTYLMIFFDLALKTKNKDIILSLLRSTDPTCEIVPDSYLLEVCKYLDVDIRKILYHELSKDQDNEKVRDL